ncbi:MAG TPA: DNA methyltransferase, partial [Candidatus Elarobacter sp.]|nr:DNA methyltransferase [Candidatus Elarobacter sp.]
MSTREAPPVARITSRFHHGFRIEQQRLAASVSGLDDDASRERYASLLLDRLMFVFFVQAKGFLDGDPSYMQTKLAASRSEGPDRYFRRYLLPLFSDGLGALRDARSPEVTERIGDVPFLGARLFEPLPVERDHPELAVSDAAFAALYAFLGSYRWRLDERQLDDPGTEGEITPAVLGAVLERQVNREQMGAYYTRRDVTEHMAATAILPRLLAMVAHDVRAAAHLGSFPTPAECIRDNVDLRRLLPEAIGRSEDARFAAAVYDAVSCITVLDPACGSGAFLFAAMNVLAPAYTACLRRLGTTAAQPNLAYTVRKQIATQNLYGIDIMDEAVEICKLGLFLQLIACAERAEDFEPLPELGFNLRTANALTGFDWDGAFGAVSKRGGFDVVIGNPPYVTYPSVKAPYAVPSGAYRTLPAKNLYALMFERALQLVTGDGIVSFVVPLTVTSSERAAPLQRLLVARGPVFYASFPRRPRSVFEGVEMPVAIVTSLHGESGRLNSTRVVRFTAAERDGLME